MELKDGNIALTLDGPAGPYHKPKKFVLLTALLAKRRMVLMSFKFKRKIELKKRWDKYMIPLPFNKVTIHFYGPIEIRKGDHDKVAQEITEILESTP